MDDLPIKLAVLNRAGAPNVHQNMLAIGSDIEIAGRVKRDICKTYGQFIHAEGQFWRYCATHWKAVPEHQLRLAVHKYDGAFFSTPGGGVSASSSASHASTLLSMNFRLWQPNQCSFRRLKSASTAARGLSSLKKTERRALFRTRRIIVVGTPSRAASQQTPTARRPRARCLPVCLTASFAVMTTRMPR